MLGSLVIAALYLLLNRFINHIHVTSNLDIAFAMPRKLVLLLETVSAETAEVQHMIIV